MYWIIGKLTVLLTFLVVIVCLGETKGLTLTVLHTNDVHSRFLETSKYSGACTQKDKSDRKCYGGFARLHHKV